jgi:hypothetical protein
MYYTGAGGVAGGVVVGYLASDSALGFLNLIRLCRGLGKVCLCVEIIGFAIKSEVLVISICLPSFVAE